MENIGGGITGCAAFGRSPIERFLVASTDEDACTFVGQRFGASFAETPAGAGNEGLAVFQTKIHRGGLSRRKAPDEKTYSDRELSLAVAK
jgi:hypothetical protein